MDENLEHLETKYKECIMKLLNNDKLSYVEREFYVESPNWYSNNDINNITLISHSRDQLFENGHWETIYKNDYSKNIMIKLLRLRKY